jgi:ribonuclease E
VRRRSAQSTRKGGSESVSWKNGLTDDEINAVSEIEAIERENGASLADDATSAEKDSGTSTTRSRTRGKSGEVATAVQTEVKLGSRKRGTRKSENSGAGSQGSSNSEIETIDGSARIVAKRERAKTNKALAARSKILSESDFLATRDNVNRKMIIRENGDSSQISVLEDDLLVEHYISDQSDASIVGNVYLGKIQNILPSMEAAFVDIGSGRNAILYSSEINWSKFNLDGKPRLLENAYEPGDEILVQVTKDPISHKGARLTGSITLSGRYLILAPTDNILGISRRLHEDERKRIKSVLQEITPKGFGIIARTAAENVAKNDLKRDLDRLIKKWEKILELKEKSSAPKLLQDEADMPIRVIRDLFNSSFDELIISGDKIYSDISSYIEALSPELMEKVKKWESSEDIFDKYNIPSQLNKGLDRKVWLPSGGTLVIDKTEAMTVIDVNTGRFTGSGGSLEETVTSNNLEAAEEIVRQLRLRDLGGIIIVDFIDMILESNRNLVLQRLIECFGRDRTNHNVAEVTSLGLIQITRKRVGQGLADAFSTVCDVCHGRGFILHVDDSINKPSGKKKKASDTSSRIKKVVVAAKKSAENKDASGEAGSDEVEADDASEAADSVKKPSAVKNAGGVSAADAVKGANEVNSADAEKTIKSRTSAGSRTRTRTIFTPNISGADNSSSPDSSANGADFGSNDQANSGSSDDSKTPAISEEKRKEVKNKMASIAKATVVQKMWEKAKDAE